MAATTNLHSISINVSSFGSPRLVSQSPSRLSRSGTGLHGPGTQPAYRRSYVSGFIQKLDNSPQRDALGKIDKRTLAITLTDTKRTKNEYFCDYLRERDLFFVIRCSQPAATGVDIPPSSTSQTIPIEEPAPTLWPTIIRDDNREALLEGLSNFSVKLHVTYDEDENSIKIALQVGDQLIEWTRDSVIEPHNNIPQQTLFSIDLSQCLMKILVSRGARPFHHHNSEGDDLVSNLCQARDCLIDHIVQQIAIYNRYYRYKIDVHDSRSFINSILGALQIENLPRLSRGFRDYVKDLRNGDDIFPAQDHVELDNYVKEHIEGMSVGMIEYMALLYYQHHLDSRAEAGDACNEAWKCAEDHCQLTTLRLKLNN